MTPDAILLNYLFAVMGYVDPLREKSSVKKNQVLRSVNALPYQMTRIVVVRQMAVNAFYRSVHACFKPFIMLGFHYVTA
jgi:hypothetical protein